MLRTEVDALAEQRPGRQPLVALDEVQRMPELVNSRQDLIDRKFAQFILTGSSARKLRRARKAVVVCLTPNLFQLGAESAAVPWQQIPALAERVV